MSDKAIVIYHKNCLDGIASAYAAQESGLEAEFYPMSYNEALPVDITGRVVYFVDFSLKKEDMRTACRRAESVTVIDHHESAYKELVELSLPNFHFYYDPKHSGCVLSWNYFHGNTESMPKALESIEDRDLWKFKLSETESICLFLRSAKMDLDVFAHLIDMHIYSEMAEIGHHMRKMEEMIIEEVTDNHKLETILGHDNIPTIRNCPKSLVSKALHVLDQGHPFACCIWGDVYSLRSAEDGLNVRLIAEANGGGGHDHAAGCKVPKETK